MAVKTSLKKSYTWRMIIIAIVCVVFGIWGLYDYVWGIPAKHRTVERYETLVAAQAALAEDYAGGPLSEVSTNAIDAIEAELNLLQEKHTEIVDSESLLEDDELRQAVVSSIASSDDANWLGLLLLDANGIRQPRSAGELQASPIAMQAYEATQSALGQFKNPPERPAALNRIMQWGFILCLPFAPWCLWKIRSEGKQVYQLDDDGTVHVPQQGDWSPDEIAGIDMSRWMSKSIATLKHQDGRTAVMDDYLHKDLHLVVGAVASRLHPDEWTDEAKKVKKDDDPDEVAAAGEADEDPDIA